MILRLGSPVARWGFLAASLLLGAGLSYFSLRNGWAEIQARSLTPGGLLRAAELEPGNARNWYLLGHYWQFNLEQPDNARAIAAYERALQFDPRSPATWMDLGEAYEAEGTAPAARHAFLEAQRNYPVSAEVAWRYGNFLLRQGETSAAFAEIRRAVEEEPGRAAEAVSRCWRAASDIHAILDSVLPPRPDVYMSAIRFLALEKQTAAAMAVWVRLVRLRPPLKLEEAHPLLEALFQSADVSGARAVWIQALDLSGTPRPPDAAASLIWDGGFESDVRNIGFSWRIRPPPGTRIGFDPQVKHSGERSLAIRFDGTHNVSFDGLCQPVTVEPGTLYEFSAWLRAENVTTDRGVFFQLTAPLNPKSASAATPELRGTEPWTRLTLSWKAGKDVHLLAVCLLRNPSAKLDNKIAGTVWVDDVVLMPAAAGEAAAKVQP